MVAQEYFTQVVIDLGREYISSSEVPDGSSGVLYISLPIVCFLDENNFAI